MTELAWWQLERIWRNSLRSRRALRTTALNRHDPPYSNEEILEAAHAGNPRAPEMIAFRRAYPSRRRWHHYLRAEFALPCDRLCRPAPRYRSNLPGRVKAAYRVEDIAAQHTTLRGTNTLTGKCFLHGETHGAAFVVWPDEQRWTCFGKCGIGGNAISLVRAMRERGISWQ